MGRGKDTKPRVRRSTKTVCKNGHPRIPANLYKPGGSCRLCNIERGKVRWANTAPLSRRRRAPAYDRVMCRIDYDSEPGCWLFTGYRDPNGYGKVGEGQKVRLAHVVVYEQVRGAVPPGLELDHLCRLPPCVNPWHMEAVTHKVNLLRGDGPSARAIRDGVCKRGHPRIPENLRTLQGNTSACIPCGRELARLRRARGKGEGREEGCG